MFKNDKINGKGSYIWANKIEYKGQFKNNIAEKNGIIKYLITKDNDDFQFFKSKENNFSKNKSENFIEDEKEEENEIKNEK